MCFNNPAPKPPKINPIVQPAPVKPLQIAATSKLDPRKYNGAIFLGLNGPVVKSHGGTDAIGFYYSIDLCYRIIKGNLMHQIKNNLSHLDVKD